MSPAGIDRRPPGARGAGSSTFKAGWPEAQPTASGPAPVIAWDGDRVALHCPTCGLPATHLGSVSLTDSSGRTHSTFPGEPDAGGGMRSEDSLHTLGLATREHAARLTFWCSACWACFVLDLVQSRGQTFLEADLTPCQPALRQGRP